MQPKCLNSLSNLVFKTVGNLSFESVRALCWVIKWCWI